MSDVLFSILLINIPVETHDHICFDVVWTKQFSSVYVCVCVKGEHDHEYACNVLNENKLNENW